MEWYWWIIMAAIAAAIIWPLKIKFLKRWIAERKERKEIQEEENDE